MTEKRLGFGGVPVSEQKESLAIFHAIADQEVSMLSSFDKLLHAEITSVERAKKNAVVLADKVVAVERLFEKRNLFYVQLNNEMVKTESQINVEESLQILQTLRKLDSGINYALSEMAGDLKNLFINDVHQVYAAEEASREILKKIDGQARELYSRMGRVDEGLKGSRSYLDSIGSKLSTLRAERAQVIPTKKVSGFNHD